jgi:hypothetical protein
MSAWERWSRENPGTRLGLRCTIVAGGRGGRSQIFLSPWVTYDLPSRFTHPQELAGNAVKNYHLTYLFLLLFISTVIQSFCLLYRLYSSTHTVLYRYHVLTHSLCADYINTSVRQAANLHFSEFNTQSYSYSSLFSMSIILPHSLFNYVLMANGVCTLLII